MSLDVSKLKNVRERGGKIIACCPACAEAGHDRKGDHLVIHADGRFGCVVYSGDGPEAKEHRQRIFALCGDREIKPLAVRGVQKSCNDLSAPVLGVIIRTARTPSDKSRTYFCNKGGGLLERLERLFASHTRVAAHGETESNNRPLCQKSYNDLSEPVPSVPVRDASDASGGVIIGFATSSSLNRALTESELSILRAASAENDSVILTALNLFNATIAE